MTISEVKWLRALDEENARLKPIVAQQEIPHCIVGGAVSAKAKGT